MGRGRERKWGEVLRRKKRKNELEESLERPYFLSWSVEEEFALLVSDFKWGKDGEGREREEGDE